MTKLRRKKLRSHVRQPARAHQIELGDTRRHDAILNAERFLSTADLEFLWDIPRWNSFEEMWPSSSWMYDKFRAGGQPVMLLASHFILDRASHLPPESMEWAARIEIEICAAERINSLYEETGLMAYYLHALWFSSEFVDYLGAVSDLDDDKAIGLDIKATTKKITYQQHDDLEALGDAIEFSREALVFLESIKDETKCRVISTLASLLRFSSSQLHNGGKTSEARERISEAIELLEALNAAARADSKSESGLEPSETASALADALLTRYQQAGQQADLADLDNSTSWWKESLDLTPRGHRALPLRLAGLGLAALERARSLSNPAEGRELRIQAMGLLEKAYALAGPFSNHRDELVHRLVLTKTEYFHHCAEQAAKPAALAEAIRCAEELFEIRRMTKGEMLMQEVRWIESGILLFRLLHEATVLNPDSKEARQHINELEEQMHDIVTLKEFLAEGSEGTCCDRVRNIALQNRKKTLASPPRRSPVVIDPIPAPLPGKASLRRVLSSIGGTSTLVTSRQVSLENKEPTDHRDPHRKGKGIALHFGDTRAKTPKATAEPRSESRQFEDEVREAEKAEDDVPLEWATLTALDGLAAAVHSPVAKENGELVTWEYRLRFVATAWTRRFVSDDSWTATRAAELWQDMIARSQCQDDDYGRVYYDVAYVLGHTYGTTKSPLLLDLAIITGERAISILDQKYMVQLSATLGLAAMYYLRGSTFCTHADLDRGILLTQELAAKAMCMRRETPQLWTQSMVLLAAFYSARFEVVGIAQDLHQAVKWLGETALFLTPGSQGRPEILVELARHICTGAEMHGKAPEALVAVELLRAALDEPSIDGAVERGAMGTLATLLERFSDFYSDPSLAERALFLRRKIMSATSALDPLWPVFALDLAQQLYTAGTTDPAVDARDYDEAVDLLHDAIRHTPPGHSLRSRLLMNLARVLLAYPEPDMKAVIEAADDALRNQSSPSDCISAARLCAEVYHQDGKLEEAYTRLLRAIDALQSVSPRWLSLSDRQRLLKDIRGVQSDAACLGLQLKKPPAEIVEMLEHSRTLILSSLMDFRSDLADLETVDARLCEELRDTQRVLGQQQPPHGALWELQNDDEVVDYALRARVREEANQKMDEVLQKIRKLDGFDSFLRSPPAHQLLRLANRGPIIIPIASRLARASFAILLTTSGGIQVLELPKLQPADVTKHALLLQGACNGTNVRDSHARGQMLHVVLRWLWKTTVRPILAVVAPLPKDDASGNNAGATAGSLPHVWWIPVGVLSQFPFQAALGQGQGKNRPCTMDRVISSYAPSLRSLLFVRSQQSSSPVLDRHRSKFLAIAVEQTTPGGTEDSDRYPDLEGVKQEGQDLCAIFSKAAPLLDRPDATTALRAIRGRDIVHLACHGEADQTDPSASSLVLVKHREPSSDLPPGFVDCVDRLTVGRILADHHRHGGGGGGGGVAFLRACSTAHNAATAGLPDEVIHLASAFQLAGFSHALGTMWSTRNEACAAVSRRFYERLCPAAARADDESTAGDGHERVAEAFHFAVREWMRTGDTWCNPLLWASFVHFGA